MRSGEGKGALSEPTGASPDATGRPAPVGAAAGPSETESAAELALLRAENAELRADRARALQYVREKVNQLLGVMGTVALRPEELDDRTLIDLDPIGIVADAFGQVLAHHRKTHGELQVAHAEIAAVYDSAGVGIVVLDPEQRIVSYNRQAFRTVLGRDEKSVGRVCYEAICGRDRPIEVCTFERACTLHKPFRRTDWVNRDRHYDVIGTPILDADGRTTHVVLVYLDITERQEFSRALTASEERYRDLFEQANDLIQSVAPDGSFVYVNRAWLETLGYAPEEVARLSIFDVIAPECREHCQGLFGAIMSGQDVGRIEATFRAKDGHPVVLEGTVNCRFEDGQPVATRGIFRDLTERRRMEAEVARGQQLESLGLLAGGIAHDFNNLLTAILGNISLARLRAGPDDARMIPKLREAEKAVLRAQNLTHQLLTFSRGGAPVRREVSLAEVVAESVTFALSGSGSRCPVDLDPELWSAEVDAAQVSQVLQNLVLNADQSMPAGGNIAVRAANEQVGARGALPLAPGRYVRIDVSDEGVGIPPENACRVLDPYFTTKTNGTGLGLTTAFSIVQRHGGHLTFEANRDRGTTFRVYLPATGRKAAPGSGEPSPAIKGSGRVLLMDDEEMIREAAGDLLEFLGYRVERVADGAAALEKYREAGAAGEPFDAVILDLTIPGGMGGREAVGRLLELDPAAKVVASSGYSNDPVMAEYRAHGFRAVMAKPYRLETVAEVLRDLIEG